MHRVGACVQHIFTHCMYSIAGQHIIISDTYDCRGMTVCARRWSGAMLSQGSMQSHTDTYFDIETVGRAQHHSTQLTMCVCNTGSPIKLHTSKLHSMLQWLREHLHQQ